MKVTALLVIVGLTLSGIANSASAEVSEVTIAKEPGLGYLPYMIMEHGRLIEKHAKQMGLGNLKVNWRDFGGGHAMQDALIAGKVDFASSGVPHFITLWAKTHGAIKSAGALDTMPVYLNTRNPRIHGVKDFTDKDKIAVPTVKSSTQAIFLEMATARAFGPKQAFQLDPLTVSMSHPEGTTALLSGASDVDSHFTVPPYQEIELKDPHVHRVLNSYQILGGPVTLNITCVPARFVKANPRTYQAYVGALEEAEAFIRTHKSEAANIYLQMTGDKRMTHADLMAMLNDPQFQFATTPLNVMKLVNFMYASGTIKTRPASWKEMFFSNMSNRKGS